MRISTILFALIISSSFYCQSVCDSLQIMQVSVDAFSNDRINIKVYNSSSDIFSYPGFRIYDENDNLIGEEEVWFFGIAGESNHVIEFDPSIFLFETVVNYNLIVELWTNFYDELVCSFEYNTIMIPQPIDCVDLSLIFSEFSTEQVSYEVELVDNSGIEYYSEVLTFQPNVGFIERYVCVPPTCFQLSASTDIQAEFSHLNVNLEALYSYGFLFSELLDKEQSNSLEFGLWTECETLQINSSATSVPIKALPNPANDLLYVESEVQFDLRVIDLMGNVVIDQQRIHFGMNKIEIEHLFSGIYFLQSTSDDQFFNLSFIKM